MAITEGNLRREKAAHWKLETTDPSWEEEKVGVRGRKDTEEKLQHVFWFILFIILSYGFIIALSFYRICVVGLLE